MMQMKDPRYGPKPWMRVVLVAIGVCSIIMGLTSIIAPHVSIRWAGYDHVQPVEIWQYMGVMIGVFGLAYLIAAINPFRHWVVVFVGFTVKLLAVLGFLCLFFAGLMDTNVVPILLLGSVIWLPFFALILVGAARQPYRHAGPSWKTPPIDEQLERFTIQEGNSLNGLSQTTPLMLVFLRHFGSPFCRESLAEIALKRQQIEASGLRIVLVHMAPDDVAQRYLSRYQLDDLARVSDPQCELYRAFGLYKGSFSQLFSMRIWWRAFQAAVLSGHGFGRAVGDVFQMPGVFVVHQGRMMGGYRPASVADRPDYETIARWTFHAEPGYE